MNTSNPVMNENVFSQTGQSTGEVMTVQGAVNKTLILLGLVLIA